MLENDEIIAANNQRLASVLGHMIPITEDNNKSKTALDDQDSAVSDLEKVFQGLPINGPKYTNVTDTTATSGDVANGKVFYDADGIKTIGSLNETILTSREILENGIYKASDDGVDGYDTIVVNVPEKALQEKTITENGEVLPDDGYGGFSKVIVNVKSNVPNLTNKAITENGVYNASDDNAAGYGRVVVNVPTYITVLSEKYLPKDAADGTIAIVEG